MLFQFLEAVEDILSRCFKNKGLVQPRPDWVRLQSPVNRKRTLPGGKLHVTDLGEHCTMEQSHHYPRLLREWHKVAYLNGDIRTEVGTHALISGPALVQLFRVT